MLDELKTVLQYSFLPAQIYCKGQFSKTFIYSISNCKIPNQHVYACVCVCVWIIINLVIY